MLVSQEAESFLARVEGNGQPGSRNLHQKPALWWEERFQDLPRAGWICRDPSSRHPTPLLTSSWKFGLAKALAATMHETVARRCWESIRMCRLCSCRRRGGYGRPFEPVVFLAKLAAAYQAVRKAAG